MARKRKNLKALDYKSPEYWNRLLSDEGLSVDAGLSDRVIYAGGSRDLDLIQEEMSAKDTGRVAPKERGR